MTNHLHLLVQPDDARHLSAMMAGPLLAYVRYVNRRSGFVGHLVKGRFKSPVIQREGYWLSCGRYIERKPLAAGENGDLVRKGENSDLVRKFQMVKGMRP